MGSGREKQVTRFLNVDLDMGGSTDDLERCLRAIEDSVVVLNRGYKEVSLELADEFASLEETVMGLWASSMPSVRMRGRPGSPLNFAGLTSVYRPPMPRMLLVFLSRAKR